MPFCFSIIKIFWFRYVSIRLLNENYSYLKFVGPELFGTGINWYDNDLVIQWVEHETNATQYPFPPNNEDVVLLSKSGLRIALSVFAQSTLQQNATTYTSSSTSSSSASSSTSSYTSASISSSSIAQAYAAPSVRSRVDLPTVHDGSNRVLVRVHERMWWIAYEPGFLLNRKATLGDIHNVLGQLADIYVLATGDGCMQNCQPGD